eukprot:Blabericola_migrator_1__1253@NODE_1323_length_4805_cov_60_313634_g868_i1_p1_GENE_NODE_1323_length_4805_cov_60_313634_g868_i1NODE_1323_length_4805_cov_60_313634_g868_i1_p1_ORF_typecomplete_len636_score70_27PP2C/PF00481_21/2_9e09PP2C/PF00481_21/9_4e55PP2C_2/PF13672_6/4_2PP2C_2/PF13672_6/5_1e14SpoIIE/PF07228_12/4e07_NODE_1323_length_4805_cov_60_313634_g868_i128934800
MGNYLTSPNCAKSSAIGASHRVAYGVSSMQGWRLSMEDSHLIHHEFAPPTPKQWAMRNSDPETMESIQQEARRIHLFGIFDGHGGPKIAQFAAKTMVRELENSPQFAEGNFEIAFKVAYCNIDRILRSQQWKSALEDDVQSGGDSKEVVGEGGNDQAPHGRAMLGGCRTCPSCRCAQPAPTDTFSDAKSDAEETLSPKASSYGYATTNESCSPPLVTPPTKLDAIDSSEIIEETSKALKDLKAEGEETISVSENSTAETAAACTTDSPSPGAKCDEDQTSDIAEPLRGGAKAKQGTGPVGPGITQNIKNAFAAVYKMGTGWWSGGSPATSPKSKESGTAESLAVRNGLLRASNPAMFSGCTAICVLLVDNTLFIANAGDSRAVLCRNGKAECLSQDHKPTLPEERQRIYAAGGFVEFGRVNGNLNLSRALGDLIYKQEINLPPEKQIVSGFPDVRKVELQPDDEFIVMGCDGIWEYYTSQDVVDFVRARFRRHGVRNLPTPSSSSSMDYAPRPAPRPGDDLLSQVVKRSDTVDLAETVEELFDNLISPSPALFEYGCDNMTAILVDLRPGSTCKCDCHTSQRQVYHAIFQQQLAAQHDDNTSSGTAISSGADKFGLDCTQSDGTSPLLSPERAQD